MTENKSKIRLVKRVYIYESSQEALNKILDFCKVQDYDAYVFTDDELLDLLASPNDVCQDMFAFFLGPTESTLGLKTAEIAKRIFDIRYNISLMIRRDENNELDEDTEKVSSRNRFIEVYSVDEVEELAKNIKKNIYSDDFPTSIISEIASIGAEAIDQSIKNVKVTTETPYLIVDQLIRGSMVSVINLYSTWCQGHLVVECNESDLFDVIVHGKSTLSPDVNKSIGSKDILAEMSNLLWGKIRSRLYSETDFEKVNGGLQVPCVIDHNSKTVRFSSRIPQLCFRYLVKDLDNKSTPFIVYVKLIFNIYWNSENFERSYAQAQDERGRNKPVEYL